jgi:hypothetical protein
MHTSTYPDKEVTVKLFADLASADKHLRFYIKYDCILPYDICTNWAESGRVFVPKVVFTTPRGGSSANPGRSRLDLLAPLTSSLLV